MSRSNFMPLSDEDDDFSSNFNVGNDSPSGRAHSRRESGSEDGHFYAGHHSISGMRAAQHQGQSARSNSGAFSDATALSTAQAGGNVQETLQAIKTKSFVLASFLKDKATQASSSVADPASRQQTLSRFKMWGAGAAEKVSSATQHGWQQAREMTSEGMKRFYGGPLAAICRQESSQRPCPRTVLICCTAITTGGLYTEGIFKEEAPAELVHYLLGAFDEGQGICLPPPGTDPIVIAAALKHFLLTLPEPLFTYKCLPAIISAGQETVPNRTPEALAELPAASLNALTILLETWHRIAENSTANGMDSRALAVAVTPCLAWNPPLNKEARKGYMTIGVPHEDDGGSWRKGAAQFPETAADEVEEGGAMARSDLEPQDLAAIISVVDFAIANFRGTGGADFDGPLYDYGASPVSSASPPAAIARAPSLQRKPSEGGKLPAPTAQMSKPSEPRADTKINVRAQEPRRSSSSQFSLI